MAEHIELSGTPPVSGEEIEPQKLAVLFTDVVGSSVFFKKHGNRAGRAMLRRHKQIVSKPVGAHDGTVVKTIGDSVMATFLEPTAAIRAAVDIQKAFQENNRKKQRSRDRMRVRIGIHYANAIVEAQDVFGEAVNLAAKLVPFSKADRILISQPMAEAIRSEADCPVEQVDVPDPKNALDGMRVFNVVWDHTARAAPMSGFVVLARPSWSLANSAFKHAWHRMVLQNRSLWGAMADQTRMPEDRSRAAMLFRSAEKALVSARQLRSFLQKTLSGSAGTAYVPVNIVIIYGSLPTEVDESWEKMGVPWSTLDVGDIHIAREAAAKWPTDVLPETDPGIGGPERPAFYRLGSRLSSSDHPPLFQFQDAIVQGEFSTCFYCGDRRHPAVTCPTKALDGPPQALETIGHMATAELNALFRDALAQIRQHPTGDGLALSPSLRRAFEAVYEIHWTSQLGFFRVVWTQKGDHWDQLRNAGPKGKRGGRLWLAQDCIRTGNSAQAETLLSALDDDPTGEFALHCLRGFLYVDQNRPAKAALAFEDALSAASSDSAEIVAHLLLHRLFKIQDDRVRCERHLAKALLRYKYCPEAIYEEIKLMLDRDQSDMALKRLEGLIADVPTYFSVAMIDPELGPHAQTVVPLLRQILDRVIAEAADALAAAQHQIDRLGELIQDANWMAKESAIIEEIGQLMAGESYLGCLDAVQLAQRMATRIDSAIGSRKQMVAERIFDLNKACKQQAGLIETLHPSSTVDRIRTRLDQMTLRFQDAKARISAESPRLFVELEPLLRQTRSDLRECGRQIKRLYDRQEIRLFLMGFMQKSIFYQGVNLAIAAVCVPLLSHYINLLLPGLYVSSQTLGAYQKIILIVGALAGLMVALLQTLKQTYPRWKAHQRNRLNRLNAIP